MRKWFMLSVSAVAMIYATTAAAFQCRNVVNIPSGYVAPAVWQPYPPYEIDYNYRKRDDDLVFYRHRIRNRYGLWAQVFEANYGGEVRGTDRYIPDRYLSWPPFTCATYGSVR
jgi:hypothetical protein